MIRWIGCLLACLLVRGDVATVTNSQETKPAQMKLGNFSVSLTVKDLKASRAFYEKLGFKMRGGDPAQNWVVMQNGA